MSLLPSPSQWNGRENVCMIMYAHMFMSIIFCIICPSVCISVSSPIHLIESHEFIRTFLLQSNCVGLFQIFLSTFEIPFSEINNLTSIILKIVTYTIKVFCETNLPSTTTALFLCIPFSYHSSSNITPRPLLLGFNYWA